MTIVATLLAGCAALPPWSCPASLKSMRQAELFFGRDIPGGGQVSEDEWRRFLDEEVTPRFPDGLTVQDAAGQWMGAGGIVREKSKRLTIVLLGDPTEREKLEAIRTAYKSRFRQEAVLLLETQGCGSF